MKYKLHNVDLVKASVKVRTVSSSKMHTITFKGEWETLADGKSFREKIVVTKGDDLLTNYLENSKILKLDDGQRVPLSQIELITPIKTESCLKAIQETRGWVFSKFEDFKNV